MTLDDQIERVARAIYEERFQGKNVMPFEAFRVDHERTYARLEAQARAAISAMRPALKLTEGERAIWGVLRDQVVTFCFLIESRDDVSNEVKQRSKGAREAVYAMGRAIAAISTPPEATSDQVERVARIIDPSSWSVMDAEKERFLRKYKGENIGYPKDQFRHKESMVKASLILSALRMPPPEGEAK